MCGGFFFPEGRHCQRPKRGEPLLVSQELMSRYDLRLLKGWYRILRNVKSALSQCKQETPRRGKREITRPEFGTSDRDGVPWFLVAKGWFTDHLCGNAPLTSGGGESRRGFAA